MYIPCSCLHARCNPAFDGIYSEFNITLVVLGTNRVPKTIYSSSMICDSPSPLFDSLLQGVLFEGSVLKSIFPEVFRFHSRQLV